MAMLLIASAILAYGPAAAPPAPGMRNAVALQRCERALARRGYASIQSPTIRLATRSGRSFIYRGEFNMLLRPVPGGPGEVTPMHIQRGSYGFTCVVRGSRVRRLSVREE
jgi:hypothetical protein